MAIRQHFRRALRQSSASSSGGSNDAGTAKMTTTTTAASDLSVSSKKSSSSLLSRTFTWGSSRDKSKTSQDKPPKQPKKSTRGRKKPVHPSEKPLTAQNLRHQEMLSQFTWTFGASDPAQVEGDDFFGVSPCCTRTPSIIGDSDADASTESDGGSLAMSPSNFPLPDLEGGR